MAYKMSDDDESDVVIPWTALASSQSKMTYKKMAELLLLWPLNLSSYFLKLKHIKLGVCLLSFLKHVIY